MTSKKQLEKALKLSRVNADFWKDSSDDYQKLHDMARKLVKSEAKRKYTYFVEVFDDVGETVADFQHEDIAVCRHFVNDWKVNYSGVYGFRYKRSYTENVSDNGEPVVAFTYWGSEALTAPLFSLRP